MFRFFLRTTGVFLTGITYVLSIVFRLVSPDSVITSTLVKGF